MRTRRRAGPITGQAGRPGAPEAGAPASGLPG